MFLWDTLYINSTVLPDTAQKHQPSYLSVIVNTAVRDTSITNKNATEAK
jgi:hypothetical protein